MKRIVLFLALAKICNISAQPIFSVNPVQQCVQGFSTFVNAGATISPSLYTHYVWTFSYTNATSSVFISSGSPGNTTVQITITQASGIYTITGTAMQSVTPVGSSSHTVEVFPQPTVAASSNTPTVCMGSTVQLSASGAVSYTWMPGNMVGPTVTALPLATSCYTVLGMDANGCVGDAVACVSVISVPPLSITQSDYSVCLGSSVSMTAAGASSYTWSTGPNTATVNVLPQVSGMYTVSGTGASGCVTSSTAWINVDTTCSKVWPGDANSDGTVDATDVLELGLAMNSTGSARNPGGNTYVGQQANNWSGTVSTGKNRCHADCDGNGTINANDTMAIFLNWNQSHSFRSGSAASDPQVYITSSAAVMGDYRWNRVDIMMGSASDPVSDVYGLVFDVNFPASDIVTDSVYLLYPTSFLSSDNQNLHFRKQFFSAGVVHGARVRTNGTHVSGHGKVAELYFFVKGGSKNLEFSISNVMKMDDKGNTAALTAGTFTQAIELELSVREEAAFYMSVSPNPASGYLELATGLENAAYSVTDLSGRVVLNGSVSGSAVIDISDLAAGVYYVEAVRGTLRAVNKVVIAR